MLLPLYSEGFLFDNAPVPVIIQLVNGLDDFGDDHVDEDDSDDDDDDDDDDDGVRKKYQRTKSQMTIWYFVCRIIIIIVIINPLLPMTPLNPCQPKCLTE